MFVKFTDYDTIIISNAITDRKKEISVNKYFKFFEKKFKQGKIHYLKYDFLNRHITYEYNNREYFVEIPNNKVEYLKIFLSFVELEEAQEQKRYDNMIEKNRKLDLLFDARNGDIKSEEAKLLYLDELLEKLKASSILKNIEFYDVAWDLFNIDIYHFTDTAHKMTGICVPLYLLATFALPLIVSLVSPGYVSNIVGYLTGGCIVGCFTGFINSILTYDGSGDKSTLTAKILVCVLWSIINIIGNIIRMPLNIIYNIKSFIAESRITKQKIKYLEEYKCDEKKIQITNSTNVWVKYVEKHVNIVCNKISLLNSVEDRRMFYQELTLKLNEYKKELSSLPESGLTIDTVGSISNSFIMYLIDLEIKINKKLESVDVIVPNFEGLIKDEPKQDEEEKPKVMSLK